MSLLHTFYPQHLLPTGEQCPVCTDPINLVVCLPPATGGHLLALLGELVDRLRAHVTRPARGGTTWTRTTPTPTCTRRRGRSPTSRPSPASPRWSPPLRPTRDSGSRRTCTAPAWKPSTPQTPTSTPTTRPDY